MAKQLLEMASVEPHRILSPEGTLLGPLPEGVGEAELKGMYRWMVRLRTFDQRALTLQRQGRLGTYPPYSGQEASQAGSVLPLRRDDWLCPTYRDHGAMITHGAPMFNILRYWMGDEWGSHLPGVNTLPAAIPIATQCIHATGLAWASKLQRQGRVAVAYFGDGATSEGDFHEALNFAGVFKLPTIFFCQNNGYAISVPIARQMANQVIASKAEPYGIHGVRVDGNDILAVWQVTHEAAERGRRGEGATLIEAMTYRYGPHTTADDPSRYRTEAEVQAWQNEKDPILRLRRFLTHKNWWDEAAEAALQEEAKAEVAEAVAAAEAAGRTNPADIFDHTYAERPWYLEEQRQSLIEHLSAEAGSKHA